MEVGERKGESGESEGERKGESWGSEGEWPYMFSAKSLIVGCVRSDLKIEHLVLGSYSRLFQHNGTRQN